MYNYQLQSQLKWDLDTYMALLYACSLVGWVWYKYAMSCLSWTTLLYQHLNFILMYLYACTAYRPVTCKQKNGRRICWYLLATNAKVLLNLPQNRFSAVGLLVWYVLICCVYCINGMSQLSVTTDILGYIFNPEKNMRLPGNGNYL